MIQVSLVKRDRDGNKIHGKRVLIGGDNGEQIARECERVITRGIRKDVAARQLRSAQFYGY